MVLPLSSIDHQRRRLRLLGENRYPVSHAIGGGESPGAAILFLARLPPSSSPAMCVHTPDRTDMAA